jgi:Zn-finger nucleic acid-binding protein
MSKYLNDLIKSLQAEAEEHEAVLEQQTAPTSRGVHRDTGYLDRLLQRIKTLQELQVSEAKRYRDVLRSAVANRVSSPHLSRAQGNASPQ